MGITQAHASRNRPVGEIIMVTPSNSHSLGLVISAITGIVVGCVVWKILEYTMNFWYIGEVLGPVLGFVLGATSAFKMFEQGLRVVKLNWVGVGLFLGAPNGTIYTNGTHWIPPFFGMMMVPGSTEKFILEISGERIDAQDGSVIFFGMSEDEGKKNSLQYSVVNPTQYLAVNDPDGGLREAYLEVVRLFFGHASKAVGGQNGKTLFSDFIVLPPRTEPAAPAKYNTFKDRLKNAICGTTDQSKDRLFSDDAIGAIMEKAGEFREKVENWGIGNIVAFTPNVRGNPEAERAAAQKQVAVEHMTALETRANKVAELAKKMCEDVGVSADLALIMTAALDGRKNVTIENKTINISGIAEVIRDLGAKAFDKFAKPQGGNDTK